MLKINRTWIIGIVIVGVFASCFVIIGTIIYENSITPNTAEYSIYICYIALSSLSLLTVVHLWSRVPELQKGIGIRLLFELMGTSFIAIFAVFFYPALNSLVKLGSGAYLSDILDSSVPWGYGRFKMFEIITTVMPLDSILTFGLLTLGLSFLLWPVERFVKNRRPWFSISLWLTLAFYPFTFVTYSDLSNAFNVWFLSIFVEFNTFFVIFNFIYLFYLYFTLAIRSIGWMRKSSLLVAFGLISIILTWLVQILMYAFIPNIGLAARISGLYIGLAALMLFNAGFAIMQSKLSQAMIDYYQSKRICIVHRGLIKGPVFACPSCNIFYCPRCKDAIVRSENKCWNCGVTLDTSTEITLNLKADNPMFQKFAYVKDELHKESDMDAFNVLLNFGRCFLDRRKSQNFTGMQDEFEMLATTNAATDQKIDVEISVDEQAPPGKGKKPRDWPAAIEPQDIPADKEDNK